MPNNQTILYGVFMDNLWRNEKSGQSFFRIKTKQIMFLGQMYQSKEVIRNKLSGIDETWYTVVCDASDICIPSHKKGSPIKVVGFYDNERPTEYSWDFKVSEVTETTNDDAIMIQYLSSETFPDVTEDMAVKIVGTFGCDFFQMINTTICPEDIVKVTGMPGEVADDLIHKIKVTETERNMFGFLSQAHIPYPYTVKAIRYYGTSALDKIKKRPYKVGDALGLNFRQCDSIAKICGMNGVSTGRIQMAAKEVIRGFETSGHIFTPLKDFKEAVHKKLQTDSFSFGLPMTNIITMLGEEFEFQRIKGIDCVYRKSLLEAEKRIAKNIGRLASYNSAECYDNSLIKYAEKACNMKYGEQQRNAFSSILGRRGVKILTGGPGTGKTTTVKGILLAYQKMHPDHIIKLCAPTGRAAQRMAESTGMAATTMHRLLDYRPYGDNLTFKDANNPIDADVVVVDEMSMADVEIFDIFLEAVKSGTTVILVGDIHQLESVGPGAVLHDLLESTESLIQKSMLTEVFRQKDGSPIIDNAEKINNGDVNLLESDKFKIITTKSSEESLEVIKKLSLNMYNKENPFETQILCPARSGLSGIDNLNKELHELLNAEGESLLYGYNKFRVNDKIIMTKNNHLSDYYNGDIGVIKEINESGMIVTIRGDDIQLTRDMLDDIKLSYGMTIHKSQGSEFQNVIVVMPMEPLNMLVRNLFYTGVTRAKDKVIIVNESSAMQTAIKVNKTGTRRTMLPEYLPICS